MNMPMAVVTFKDRARLLKLVCEEIMSLKLLRTLSITSALLLATSPG